jgi:DNA polymerase-3 subunit delta
MTAGPVSRLEPVPAFKPAYLIHGDDHGRIAERRGRLRAMAERETTSSGVELLEADRCTPDAVVAALSTMTFAMGRRFVVADGVERWKEADVVSVAAAMLEMDPAALTVAFFAREDGRLTAPKALHAAVTAVGGVIAAESAVKARELPKWVGERAREAGVSLDRVAAQALIAQVGDRQQRLQREIEKLSLYVGEGAAIGLEDVELASANSSERKAWTLADAVVAGDREGAVRALLELRQQGERIPGLLFGVVRKVREAGQVAEALAAGRPAAEIRRTLRMPSFAADRLIAHVRERDVESYRQALELLADLELESRGGGAAALGEETTATRAVLAMTAAG